MRWWKHLQNNSTQHLRPTKYNQLCAVIAIFYSCGLCKFKFTILLEAMAAQKQKESPMNHIIALVPEFWMI